MMNVSTCPVCGSTELRSTGAMVSPFLAKRIWDRKPFTTSLNQCGACDFLFFNPRLEPAEEARLYWGYRDTEYLKDRNAVEPWYTERFNASLTEAGFVRQRKAKIAAILQRYLSENRAYRILDFGGAHGELVQGLLPGCRPYVYEISNVAPLDGVTACHSLKECRQYDFDVILCSNVL